MKKVAIYSRKSVLVEGSVSIETQINIRLICVKII
ncbi:hypothetical protein Cp4446_03049 [Clostridium perfringens]|nr:hypothetical protein [Clostridium perfringens]